MQRVGLYIGTQFPPGVDVSAALKDMSEQVRVARQSGFSSLWVPHHYLTQPMQMLAPRRKVRRMPTASVKEPTRTVTKVMMADQVATREPALTSP